MALATMWGVFEMSCSDKGILEVKKAVLFYVVYIFRSGEAIALLTMQHLRCNIARCAVYIIL